MSTTTTHMRCHRLLWACALALPALARGQGVDDGWTVEITPYLWAAGLDGDTAADGVGSEIDTDYEFLSLDNLDFALGAAVEARKNRWGALFDAMYVDFSDAFERAPGNEVELKGLIAETTGSMAAANGRPLELLFGLRYVALKSTVELAPIASADMRKSWLDPFVGLTYSHAFNDRWSVKLRGDVGGFGVSSELATNVAATFGLRVGDKLTLRGGYRLLQMDFDDAGFVLDATAQGYVLGVSWATR